MTGTEIYQQAIDKQRILVVGGGNDLIAGLIVHTLIFNNRKFDYIGSGNHSTVKNNSPVIISNNISQCIDYKHHVVILGNSTSGMEPAELEQLADATPKGGTLIYSKADVTINRIGSKERADIQSIGYEVYKHEQAGGKTKLISSTGERYSVALSSESDLLCVSAARELLKKVGITSNQFYNAISAYKSASI